MNRFNPRWRGASMRRAASVGATLVAVVLFAACGEAEGEAFPLPTQEAVPMPAAELTAIVSGVLEVDLERGCTWLDTERGRYEVVWPHGTTAKRDPFVLRFADGSEARPSDFVSGGGGWLSRAPAVSIPCYDGGAVATFNHYSPIEVEPAE
ncbi:MAG: hypothetical protein R3C39_00365 [Dehalococcoidia bacterium]